MGREMAAEWSRSGRRSGRPNMPCACMLRQLRLHQALADNAATRVFQAPPPPPLPVARAPTVGNDGRTLQLFPVRADGAAMARQRPSEMRKAPMTIFYGGQVIKVENVPLGKGKQLIQMARSVSNPPPPEKVLVVVDITDEEPGQIVADPSAAVTANQARKLSLSVQRLLGKRKQSRTDDPDDEEEASPSKKMDAGGNDEPFEDVPDASWLSL